MIRCTTCTPTNRICHGTLYSISGCGKLPFQFLGQFMLTDCLGLEGLDDSGPCARGRLLLHPLPERCSKASDLVSVLFDLNAVQLVRLQSQLHPHFSPQGWNLSSHLVQKINIARLIVQSSILTWVCNTKTVDERIIMTLATV